MYNIQFGGVEAFTIEGLDDLEGKKKKKKGRPGWLKRYRKRKKARLKLFKRGGPLAALWRKKQKAKKEAKLKRRSIAINVGLFPTQAAATAALAKKAAEIARNPNFVVTTSSVKATKVGTSTMYQATLYYVDKAAEAAAEEEATEETWAETQQEVALDAQKDVANEALTEGDTPEEIQMMMAEAETTGEAAVPAPTGLPTWAWVAIGAGGLVVVGGIAYVVLGRKKA